MGWFKYFELYPYLKNYPTLKSRMRYFVIFGFSKAMNLFDKVNLGYQDNLPFYFLGKNISKLTGVYIRVYYRDERIRTFLVSLTNPLKTFKFRLQKEQLAIKISLK